MRKSPYKHHVKKHLRKGNPVVGYNRGKGKQPIKPTFTKHKKEKSLSNFRVHIKYTMLKGEKFRVQATDASNAIKQTMIMRRLITSPLEVVIERW